MNVILLAVHTDSQRKAAGDACRALRHLDPVVLKAVLKHWRDSDLPGSAGRINAAIADYSRRLNDAGSHTDDDVTHEPCSDCGEVVTYRHRIGHDGGSESSTTHRCETGQRPEQHLAQFV